MTILLGITTAVGGGVLRDILLNRVPVILEREVYALAALAGAVIVVCGDYLQLRSEWVSVVALVTCFTLRILALHYHWNLPSFANDSDNTKS